MRVHRKCVDCLPNCMIYVTDYLGTRAKHGWNCIERTNPGDLSRLSVISGAKMVLRNSLVMLAGWLRQM